MSKMRCSRMRWAAQNNETAPQRGGLAHKFLTQAKRQAVHCYYSLGDKHMLVTILT